MTATRIGIIILVLFAVLFGITLALGHRDQGSPNNAVQKTIDKWQAKLSDLGKLNLEDVQCPMRKDAVLTIPNGVQQIQATIRTNSGHGVRRLNLVLTSGTSLELKFSPNPGDDRATPSKVTMKPGKTNTIAVFAPGGSLTLTRPVTTGISTVEIR